MTGTISEVLQIRAQDVANQKLGELIAGAEAVALLTGAINSGIIDALSTESTAQQIATSTSLEKEKIDRVLGGLVSYGFVQQNDGVFRLAPNLNLLTSADALLPLVHTLQVTNIRLRNLANLEKTATDYTALEVDERTLPSSRSHLGNVTYSRLCWCGNRAGDA